MRRPIEQLIKRSFYALSFEQSPLAKYCNTV